MLSCAVIGCGAAGMAACTALRRSGLLVTCFELAAEPGGVWNSDTRSPFSSRGLVSPVHPTMRCVLPKDLMSFSDLRFDYTVPQFPHHSSVCRYLEQYAEKTGTRGLVRPNTKVQSARYDGRDAVWRLITVNVVNGDVFEWSFDKVCVCTGQTQEPRYPDGIKEVLQPYLHEGGELHHASHVKDFRQFKGKRVVVVGDGVTALDYCWELLRCGSDAYHSSCQSLYMPQRQLEGFATRSSAPLRQGGAMRDAASAALQLLSRSPGWRNDVTKGNRIVSDWIHFRNAACWGGLPGVGHPLRSEGRGILFTDPPRRPNDVVEEAKTRSMARERRSSINAVDDGPSGLFVDNIDAVICATGYNTRYPFLHRDVREVLEGPPPPQIPQKEEEGEQPCAPRGASPGKPTPHHRGLYLGTLYAHNPSIAFVGMQKELLPPFLLFEAQAKFISYAFTQRLKLPHDVEGLLSRQSELMERYPLLENLYSPEGLGLYSALYFNVLQEELQVGSRNTYTASIMERRRWILTTSLLRVVHKLRSMAPLKRKRQHLLFSNAV
ncbi:dimethylaniline monooxygenase (N-oxide forming) [Trypanosoma conorhini]|uniref:Dimethylaniline monooxygenase (N-oxide forming) n=1 Tax=Trypanosoma conorhini TaxID=83891 RepID=A0A422PV86_9TRYP|nr:dimethylaniline monooxygenase (N-oxide forming) [Trypanosoma conorhini]RNF21699.1 dimethylaniline monooxygenase (N-oxide forming) [Trypanosoma conorhini]